MMTTTTMGLQFGNRKTLLAIDSIADAARAVNALRNKMELAGRGGVSRFPQVRILDTMTGQTIAHVSYNGRVWEGKPGSWTTETKELR